MCLCADTICNDTQISILNGCLIAQLVVLCDCDTHTHTQTLTERYNMCACVGVRTLPHTHREGERRCAEVEGVEERESSLLRPFDVPPSIFIHIPAYTYIHIYPANIGIGNAVSLPVCVCVCVCAQLHLKAALKRLQSNFGCVLLFVFFHQSA